MENNILLHRRAVQQNIMKSFDSDFESFDELEKGKWNVGDQKFFHGNMHYVAELKPDGSPRWKRVKKTSGGSDDTPSQKNVSISVDKKKGNSSYGVDEMKKKLSEYKEDLQKKTEYLDKLVDASYDDPNDNKKIADMHRKIRSIKRSIKELEEKIASSKNSSVKSDKNNASANNSQQSTQKTSKTTSTKDSDNTKSTDDKKSLDKVNKKKNKVDKLFKDFDSVFKMKEDESKKLWKKIESDSVSFFKDLGFEHLNNENYGYGDYHNYFLKKIKRSDLNNLEVEVKPSFEMVHNRITSKLEISIKNNLGNVVFDASIESGYRSDNTNGIKKIMNLSEEFVNGKNFLKTLSSNANMFDKNDDIENQIKRLSNLVSNKIKKNVWNMTDSDLIKEFKIPKAVLHHNKRYTDGGESSSHDKDFLNMFRKMFEKYGNPVEIEKEKFSNYWEDGEALTIKFKTKDGKILFINNIKYL